MRRRASDHRRGMATSRDATAGARLGEGTLRAGGEGRTVRAGQRPSPAESAPSRSKRRDRFRRQRRPPSASRLDARIGRRAAISRTKAVPGRRCQRPAIPAILGRPTRNRVDAFVRRAAWPGRSARLGCSSEWQPDVRGGVARVPTAGAIDPGGVGGAGRRQCAHDPQPRERPPEHAPALVGSGPGRRP